MARQKKERVSKDCRAVMGTFLTPACRQFQICQRVFMNRQPDDKHWNVLLDLFVCQV